MVAPAASRSLEENRATRLDAVSSRFSRRWKAGIVAGTVLVIVNWVGYSLRLLDLRSELDDLDGAGGALDVLGDLWVVNAVLTVLACAVLVVLAVVLFRPLDRVLAREVDWIDRIERERAADAAESLLDARVQEAFEMGASEEALAVTAEHVFASTLPGHAVELLTADSSEAHMTRWASNPLREAPGCTVGSPFDCPAVKRSRSYTCASSNEVNACAHLRDRGGEPHSAHCVPVAFMGRSLGVLHLTGPDGEAVPADVVRRSEYLADQLATRIGTVRAFAKVQLQASTDGLTGVSNRRTIEEHLRQAVGRGEPIAVVIADLDHFKRLNDLYGHELGDQALRTYAATIRRALRSDDLFGRWGGEEFVMALPGASAATAVSVLDRARLALSEVCATGKLPVFTASYGVTDTTISPYGVEEVLRVADEALSIAKQAGRDRIVTVGDALWSARTTGVPVVTNGEAEPWQHRSTELEQLFVEGAQP
jgi:diguanylate cyclase (GGDEF)-like protein